MGFRITKGPHRVWQEVSLTRLDEDGTPRTTKVRLQFEILDDHAFAEGLSQIGHSIGNASREDREQAVDFLASVTHDWKGFEDEDGQALDWDEDQYRQLLLYPWFAEPVYQSLLAARRGRKPGN